MSAFRGAEPKTLPEALELYVRCRDIGAAMFTLIDPFEAAELGKHLIASLTLVGDQLIAAEDHIQALTQTLQEMERILAAKIAEEAGGQTLIDFALLASDAAAYEAEQTVETEARRAAWAAAIERATTEAERFLPIPWAQGSVTESVVWRGASAGFHANPEAVIKDLAGEIASLMASKSTEPVPRPSPSEAIETTSRDD